MRASYSRVLLLGLLLASSRLLAPPEPATCPLALALIDGESLQRVFVVTHQQEFLHAETLQKLLKDVRYRDIPVLLLNSEPLAEKVTWGIDPRPHPELQGRAVVHTSILGETSGVTINAAEIHLAGGSCGVCLSNTFEHLFRDFQKGDRKQTRIIVHRSLIYPQSEGTAGEFLRTLIVGRVPELSRKEVPSTMWGQVFEIPLPSDATRRFLIEVIP